MSLRYVMRKHLAKLKSEARKPYIKEKLNRLAVLNTRSVPLTVEEEIERQFLFMTLPHVVKQTEIEELLVKIEELV